MFTSKPKAILSAIILCLMAGCVKETEVRHASKSVDITNVSVINDARNTTLYINDCNVCDVDSVVMEYGDSLSYGVTQKSDTIVLDGGITSNGFWLYEGLMYAPFGRVIKSLDLCDSTWNRILHPISFDAEVNDWKR